MRKTIFSSAIRVQKDLNYITQGCILSPWLLKLRIYSRDVLHVYEDGVAVNGRNILNLRYTDDTLIVNAGNI